MEITKEEFDAICDRAFHVRCETCQYYEWDNWYPGEHECTNEKSFRCGETVDKYDSCDCWERWRE